MIKLKKINKNAIIDVKSRRDLIEKENTFYIGFGYGCCVIGCCVFDKG